MKKRLNKKALHQQQTHKLLDGSFLEVSENEIVITLKSYNTLKIVIPVNQCSMHLAMISIISRSILNGE